MAKKRRSHSRGHKGKQRNTRRHPRQDYDLRQMKKTIYGASNMMIGGMSALAIGQAASATVKSMIPP